MGTGSPDRQAESRVFGLLDLSHLQVTPAGALRLSAKPHAALSCSGPSSAGIIARLMKHQQPATHSPPLPIEGDACTSSKYRILGCTLMHQIPLEALLRYKYSTPYGTGL